MLDDIAVVCRPTGNYFFFSKFICCGSNFSKLFASMYVWTKITLFSSIISSVHCCAWEFFLNFISFPKRLPSLAVAGLNTTNSKPN